MRGRGVLLAAALLAGGLLLGGCGAQAAMTGDDARLFAQRALAAAGVRGVDVGADVRLDPCGGPGRLAWRTSSLVAGGGGGTVELCVERHGNRAVFVRDVGPGGVGPLLTDAQFRRLEAFRFDPAQERRRGQVLRLGSAAAALVVAVILGGLRLRRRSGTPDRDAAQ